MEVNFLKIIREKKNISLAELSRKTGISSANLSNFEKGKSNLSTKNINYLLEALDITYETLFHDPNKEKLEVSFVKKDKMILSRAMKIAKNSSSNLDEEDFIDLSSALYSILFEFENIDNESKGGFVNKIKLKSIEGEAAKLFLNKIKPATKSNCPKSFHYNGNLVSINEFNNDTLDKQTG